MRSLLLLAAFAALALSPVAMASTVNAGGSSTAGGVHFAWTASYDTAANTLIFDCHLTNADDGTPVDPEPNMIATVTIVQSNGQSRLLDCVPLMNLGPQTFDHLNLEIDTVGRWSGFNISSSFRP